MPIAAFVVFFGLVLAALGGLNVHVFLWARRLFGLSARGQLALKAVLWSSLGGVVLGRVAGRLWPGVPVAPVIAVGSTLELAVIITGILLLLVSGAIFLSQLPARFRRVQARAPSVAPAVVSPAAPAPAALELPRRAFLTQAAAGSAFLIGGSSSLYGALKGRSDYSIEEVELKIPGLSPALDGFSIVQLSDVHIGSFVGEAELAIAEDLIRRAKPDLLVLTGDLLDNDPRLAPVLGRFVRRLSGLPRHGVVAISGNHDYFAGVDDVARAITSAGARMLRNDATVIGDAVARFALLGVDDVWARRSGQGPDLEHAVARLPRLEGRVAPALDLPRILLCHNPSFFAESAGRVALQLSGHTHGGQVNLGVRPADYILPGGWVAGRYDERGSILYVNRGFGTVGPPARIGAPPEVTRVLLSA
jgi:predicted MPP superfamily phosphohydrolase